MARRHRQAPLLLAGCCGVLALAAPAAVQGPSAAWRTLETAHYRLIFPAESEPWTRHAAARAESVWERVAADIGYDPPQKVDILVIDPLASANGAALPFLDRPRLLLFTSPPPPDSIAGHYRDWAEVLLVHEQAHLTHLLRPSRNPLRRGLARVLPVGPITLAAPGWAIEGYATVVEGRLTGAGRPHGDVRAALLRRWALAGKLPSYRALAGNESWLGGSMPYLVGSAFLEWLEERAGPDSLPKLWRRMTARETRDFDAAFRGVFGDAPGNLYGRFAAELTHSAVEAERRVDWSPAGDPSRLDGSPAGEPSRIAEGAAEGREGELWLDLSWTTGAPAVAPGGDRLAAVRRSRDAPAELVVWSTAVDEEAERRRGERLERRLRRDPEDVAPVRTGPPPRKRLHALAVEPAPAMPRFLPGGEALLFVRFAPDAEGFLHPDLFRWRLPGGGGGVERLTRGADLRDPDPAPDGTWAVATRIRHGLSQLMRVDLASGEVEPVTEPSLGPVDRPRLSPDGEKVAFARLASGLPPPRSFAALRSAQDDKVGHERQTRPRSLRPEGFTASQDGKAEALSGQEPTAVILSEAKDLGGRMVGWELVVRTLDSGAENIMSPPAGSSAWSPVWSADGSTLFASVGLDGFVDLWAFPVDPPAPPVRLTRTIGAALAPEPTPDGKALFYLSLDADGLDIYRLELPQPLAAPAFAPIETADLVPAVPPPPPEEVAPFTLVEPGASRPYGLGRPEPAFLSAGSAGSSGDAWEAGGRVGDVIGRWDLLALGGSGDTGPRGGAAAGAWRGWPVAVGFHLFQAEERPSRQDEAPEGARRLDAERRGVELSAEWTRQGLNSSLRLFPGVYFGEIEPLPSATGGDGGPSALDQQLFFVGAEWRLRRRLGRWTLAPAAGARWDAGETGGASWDRWLATAGLRLDHVDAGSLALAWTRGRAGGADLAWDRFQVGGVGTSLLPKSALASRVLSPALPAGTLLGEEVESQRLGLELDFFLPLFAERHRVADSAGAWGEWLRVAGVELRLDSPPVPLIALPALEVRLGAARVLDPPFEDDDRWWITVVLRP